jgi:Icc-related predicted phosphoesterase
MILTILSDTHNKHKHITGDLKGGDLLLHAGDISSMGYEHEIREFAKWYNGLDNYTTKVFIAGNHDWGFQNNAEKTKEILETYKDIKYLEDEFLGIIDGGEPEIKIWGSPWQPEFYNWAFNLPRGEKLAEKWANIPEGLDILITHGPAYGMVDHTIQGLNVGCRDLFNRIIDVQPKIHVCGHIHWAYGQKTFNGIEFLNASTLNERYEYENKPIVIEYDPVTKEIEYL